jgi:hypothetical protein
MAKGAAVLAMDGMEGEVLPDEGPGHQGVGMVTRYVGRRA